MILKKSKRIIVYIIVIHIHGEVTSELELEVYKSEIHATTIDPCKFYLFLKDNITEDKFSLYVQLIDIQSTKRILILL